MGAERAVRFQDPYSVQGCTYRQAYPSSTKAGKRKASASIPIARQSMRKTAREEYQRAQDEAEADYKDYVFFSRVVDGITKQNSLLKDGSYLKSTNETLLDNIVRSRHELEGKEDEAFHNDYYYPTTPAQERQIIHNDLRMVSPINDDYYTINALPFTEDDGDNQFQNDYEDGGNHFQNDDEDEGMFDFEL